MARVAKTTTKDIESLEHREARRKNIPTAELEAFVSEDEQAPKTIRYIAEIRYGIEPLAAVDRSRKRVEAWLANELRPWLSDRLLDVDEDVLVIWRRLVEKRKAMCHTFPQADLFIGATAILHDLCVVTRNVDDFLRTGVPLLNPWTDTHPR